MISHLAKCEIIAPCPRPPDGVLRPLGRPVQRPLAGQGPGVLDAGAQVRRPPKDSKGTYRLLVRCTV